jgi:steroid delta-isomerase-like uncharacterized protein
MKARFWFASTVVLASVPVLASAPGCGGGGGGSQTPPTTPTASASATLVPPPSASVSASVSATPPAPKPAMIDLQKKSIRASVDAFGAHDPKRLAALYADGATMVERSMSGQKESHGRDEIERSYARVFAPFPDAKLGVSRVFAKGDVIVAEFAWTGTHEGTTQTLPKPTHKKVGQRAATVQHFDADGLITREEVYMDDPTIAMQLGMKEFPGKPRPVPELPTGDPTWVTDADDASLDAAKSSGWTAFYGKHDRKGFENAITDDTVHVDLTTPTDTKGKKALLAEYDQWLKIFPDMETKVGDGWGFKDGWAVYEVTVTGTMKGAWGPNRPTNKPVTTHILSIDQMKDGKIASSWTYGNSAEAIGQINPPKPKK